jgi:hypothetical protein
MTSHETVPIVKCSRGCGHYTMRGHWENKAWVWQLEPDGLCIDHALAVGKRVEHYCGGLWEGNICTNCGVFLYKSAM